MIRVNRTTKPQVLQRLGPKWLADLQASINELDRLEKDPQATKQTKRQAKNKVEKARQKYNHPEIKKALVGMFHGKCAYCESQITAVTYGHIEHFHPKSNSQYVDKTFEWENFLLSCDICNNPQHKGTKFPLAANNTPLLIDPTDGVTDPTTHLRFSWDAQAGLASIYGRDVRGQAVERIFDFNGVNGRKALIKARSEYVKKLMILLRYAQSGSVEALAILKEACQPDAPYTVFALLYIAPHITS